MVLENHDWADIQGNPSAPYINQTLLPKAAHASRYFNPPGNHPSEPNYLWLEGGTSYGIRDDGDPATHSLPNTDHLVALLDRAGLSWKSYQEGIDGKQCPLRSEGQYAAKHNPMVFFDDVTSRGDPLSNYCIAHVRPLQELAEDLQNGRVARYNFITPDLCNDMHDVFGCPTRDSVRNGDLWLSRWVPTILSSPPYQEGGALFITWDESEDGDKPIGMLVLSPFAKPGYSGDVRYSHSSTLRTFQEIFGVGPFLCDAANASDLSALFSIPP
jgi:phosphatidylinositol-3-phosphatase